MSIVLSVIALLGLVLFAVGAVLWLFVKPANPTHVMLMVIGGLVYAVAQIVILFDLIF